jgi:hypothetical protein
MRYLAEPAVKWNGGRISGELKNVPIKGVLEDLLRGESYDCTVSGELKGNISISFENLTVEASIRKIMRNSNYNYSIVTSGAHKTAGTDRSGGINELVIYQADSTIRFARVLRAQTVVSSAVPMPSEPIAAMKPLPRSEPSEPVAVDKPLRQPGKGIEHLDNEIKAFMEELLAANKVSREEYEQALNDVLELEEE